jgi:ATP-dependent helicase/nuclease subunit A
MSVILDEQARSLAATTFDRNVVVTASAGTGKTTLLITRLVHLLVKSPEAVPLSQVVALTFMNKAANEIKIRLRECFDSILAPDDSPAARDLWDRYRLSAADLRTRYRLSTDELRGRVEAALGELETCQIGTIHSFAAHLLRLYPLEAGVDPRFMPDEEFAFDDFFAREWRDWLDGELGGAGPRQEQWKRVLRGTDLAGLELFAKAVVNDLIPLAALKDQVDGGLAPTLRSWLERKQQRAGEFLSTSREGGKKPRQIEALLAAADRLFGHVLSDGPAGPGALEAELRMHLEQKDVGAKPPAGWSEEEFEEAANLVRTAKAVLASDHAFFGDLLELLEPFAAQCRQRFLDAGYVRFDGLLARARDLVKTHPHVRARLKRLFKAILVDEFQDTDPVQYEILLFLAEHEDRLAEAWPQIRLHPGKLFIVGDPKQSIFAFRRADIEAFQRVRQMVEDQDGLPLTLTRNFRSHGTILAAVNQVFDRLIRESPGLQPRYDPLEPDPDRKTGACTQGVELRLVAPAPSDEEPAALSAEEGVEAEAEAVAQWLKHEVIGHEVLIEGDGRRRPVEPGDVALLFRTFTQSWEYLGALRRHGLPYVAEGERHFYQRQEVIDLANLLCCVQNPHDQVALMGVLRSAVGALTDREIMDLVVLGPLDYCGGGPSGLDSHPKAAHLRRLYAALASLHRDCPLRPLPDALDLIFERLPVLELAAASSHGEQAVANLWKVRALTEDLVAQPGMTLAGFVEVLKARLDDPPDESESGLAEEASREAVRIMSIHKAKGLEFPIVILVGLQAGTKPPYEPIQVQQDWSTGVLGLRLGDRCTLGGVYVAEKLEARLEAERRRLLYVGMTRAKERLVLSGALTRRQSPGNFLALLTEGNDLLTKTVIPAGVGKRAERGRKKKDAAPRPDLKGFEARWRAREDRWTQGRQRSLYLTPSQLKWEGAPRNAPLPHPLPGAPQGLTGTTSPALASAIGSLVHKVLEGWSYRDAVQVMLEQLDRRVAQWLPDEFKENRDEILEEARGVLQAFARSDAYAELREATILGREVPFLMPWPYPDNGQSVGAGGARFAGLPPALVGAGGARFAGPSPALVGAGGACFAGPSPALMEGRLDLIYKRDGKVWLADYKTDRVIEADAAERAEAYREQARLYTEAVRHAVGHRPAGFKVIFLRLGKAVPVV